MLDDELIGDVGLQQLEDGPEVELLYRLLPMAWGQGLGTEAADVALDYGFSKLVQKQILAVIAEENAPSRSLARTLGFEAQEVGVYYGHHLLCHRLTPEAHARAMGSRAVRRARFRVP